MSSVIITCTRTTTSDSTSLGHETYKVVGKMLSLETLLFLMEGSSSFHKQNLFLSKLQELQSDLDCVPFGGFHMIVDHRRINSSLLKGNPLAADFSQFQHKKVLKSIRDFGSDLTIPQKVNLLKTLVFNYKVPPEKVFGTTILGHEFFRYDDPARYKHAFGLADAVSLSMSNLGVRVRFNTKHKTSGIPQLDFYHGIGNTKMTGTTRYIKSHTTKKNKFLLTLHYLRNFPRNVPEKAYVKLIKLLLAGTFSLKLGQELPKGFSDLSFGVFPISVQNRLDRALLNKRERARFYFNLLQSKAVCAPVGEDMIHEAYLNHRASICRPESEVTPRDEELYEGLVKLGDRVGRIIRDNGLFDPLKTTLPNSRACVERSGKDGGNIKEHKQRSQVISYRGNPILKGEGGITRFEPLVIGLFGPPASGKSTLLQQIVAGLSRYFPERDPQKLTYSRSCSMKHWDGYDGQPIVILDDFGQIQTTRDDINEFSQLVSVNPYMLPMAELKHKGMFFNSPIIVLTSNCQYGGRLLDQTKTSVVEDSWAIWRRVHLPYFVEAGKLFPYDPFPRDFNRDAWHQKYKTLRGYPSGNSNWASIETINDKSIKIGNPISRIQFLDIISTELKRRMLFHESNLSGSWDQIVSRYRVEFLEQDEDEVFLDARVREIDFPIDERDHTLLVRFPNVPPLEAPKVKPVALSEPLKVRMITAAEADTKCLQPLQRALWKALSFFPEMCLTNGVKDLESFTEETLPWIYRIEEVIKNILSHHDSEEDWWLSGDYTSATDNLHMWVTEALLEGILRHIPHQYTKMWAEWECSPHDVLYQEIHGGKARQTSGQLMGSLLSFPLLCLANYFTLKTAGFESTQFLVNGDDVAARGRLEQINSWRSLAPRLGLSLSIGKNFIDRDFVTINSQLFYRGQVQHTGKVSCQTRHGTTLGYCFQEAQFYWGNSQEMKAEFIRRNLPELKKTPRSLDMPVSLGGLGMYLSDENFIQKSHGRFKLIYFFDLLKKYLHPDYIGRKNDPCRIGIVKVPCIRGEAAEKVCLHLNQDDHSDFLNRLLSLQTSSKEEKFQQDLSFKDLRNFEKLIRKDNDLGVFGRIVDSPKYRIRNFPPLTSFRTRYLAVPGKRAFDIQNLVLKQFAQFWLDSREGLLSQDPWLYFDIEDIEMKDYFRSVRFESVLEELVHRYDVQPLPEPNPVTPMLSEYREYNTRTEEDPHPSSVYQKYLLTSQLSLTAKLSAGGIDVVGSDINSNSTQMPMDLVQRRKETN